MDIEILSLLSFFFGFFCILREIVAIIRRKQIRISNLFFIMYGLTYGIILSLLLVFYEKGIYRTTGYFVRFDYTSVGIKYSAVWLAASVVGYLCCKFGMALRIGTKSDGKRLYPKHTDPDPLLLDYLQITSLICLCVGIVCFVIWASGWGGYSTLFLNAAAIRNGSYGLRNRVAFFAKPAQIVATVSLTSIYLVKRGKNTKLNRIVFMVSFAVSLMYYLAKDGRMAMGMYLLIGLFMANDMFESQKNIGKKFVRLATLFVVFVFVILNMDTLTDFLRGNIKTVSDDKSVLESIMSELSYIYVAGQTAVKKCMISGSPYLIGHDIGAGLFAWVPSALTPKGLIDIWDYNTYLIGGKWATAQYPTDLISTSLYDLGILGPIFLPMFWGSVISKLERVNISNPSPIMTILYYSLSMTLLRVVNYCMLSATVASGFHLFVAAVIFWGVSHSRVQRS